MEHLLNQPVILRLKTGKSGYGTSTYDEDIPINVRWEDKIKLVKNKDGEEITSSAFVLAMNPMRTDDILVHKEEEWPIQHVEEIPGFDGSIHHWEVYL
jgi:hypothetical protein